MPISTATGSGTACSSTSSSSLSAVVKLASVSGTPGTRRHGTIDHCIHLSKWVEGTRTTSRLGGALSSTSCSTRASLSRRSPSTRSRVHLQPEPRRTLADSEVGPVTGVAVVCNDGCRQRDARSFWRKGCVLPQPPHRRSGVLLRGPFSPPHALPFELVVLLPPAPVQVEASNVGVRGYCGSPPLVSATGSTGSDGPNSLR